MVDSVSQEARSRNMAAIKSKDTKPEVFLRKLLFSDGYRYRKNASYIPGHPDIYLAKYNTAIFVNGCFWHRHPGCKYAYMPKSHIEFWKKKFQANTARDEKVQILLREKGIKSIVVWECTIKRMMRDEIERERILSRIEKTLSSDLEFLQL